MTEEQFESGVTTRFNSLVSSNGLDDVALIKSYITKEANPNGKPYLRIGFYDTEFPSPFEMRLTNDKLGFYDSKEKNG